MKSILVCLFVFTVGSLAAKIPNDVDKGDAPLANTESLGKRSSDGSISQNDASLITKRNAGRPYTGLPCTISYSECFTAVLILINAVLILINA